MYRRLGGRIYSPHFLACTPSICWPSIELAVFFIRTQTHTMGLFSPPRYSIFSGDHGLLFFFFEKIYRCKLSKLSVSYYVLITTRTYETSQSCDRVHLGHLKKKLKKKLLKKNSKVENLDISYGGAS